MASGEVKRPTPTTGLRGDGLDEADEFLLIALGGEARGARIVRPVAHVHVPEIRQLGQHLDHVPAFALGGDAVGAAQLVDREPDGHRAIRAHRLLGVLDQFAQQAGAILEAPAIVIAAMIVTPLQKVHGQREAVGGVDVDDVESGAAGAQRGLAMPAPEIADVRGAHGTGLCRVIPGRGGHGARCERDLPGIQVRRVHAAVHELDGGQSTVPVNGVRHQGEGGNVGIVPQPALDVRRYVARWVDLHFLGAHHRPAAFGLHAAHGRMGARPRMSHAVAVGHLKESILGGDRADLHRLEEDVEARLPGHQRAT